MSARIATTDAAPRMPVLRRDFSWALAGQIGYAACQWLTLSILTHAGDRSVVGEFIAGLAVTAPIVLFTNLSLRNVQATDAREQYGFGHYLGLRLLGCLVAAVAIVLAVVLRRDHGMLAMAVLLVGASKLVEAVSDLMYGLFAQRHRQDLAARSMIARGVIGTLGFAAVVWWTRRLDLGLVVLTASWLAVLLAHDLPATVRLVGNPRPLWDRALLKQLAILAAPLGVVTFLTSLNSNVPRYFVEHFLSDDALGAFGAVSYFLNIVAVVIVALAAATGPRLSQLWVMGDRVGFRKLVIRLAGYSAAIGILGALGALVLGDPLLRIALGPQYAGQAHLLALVMASAGLSCVSGLLGMAAIATRAYRPLLITSIVGTAATIGFAAVLVPYAGIIGAGWALIASSAVASVPPLYVLLTTRAPAEASA